jgi:thiol-disulfide isomerase/thioredoxin
MKNGLLCLGLLLLLAGCRGGTKKTTAAPPPVTFPRVEIPVTITDPRAQAEYYAAHYWDRFDFTDTAFLSRREVLEQALVDYIVVLPHIDTAQARTSITRLVERSTADTAMYRFFREETEHYLWDPNSPMRHEELYIPVMEAILSFDKTDMATRAQIQYRYETAQKNRPGHRANDFDYVLSSGRTGKLSTLRSEYTLLFFNNPGCPACKEIIAYTGSSPVLGRFQQDGRLAVLAVYTDENLEEWRNYLPEMPSGWLVGYDPGQAIEKGRLYDLKAIPSLYLLDKNKTVLLKDADIRQVESYLQQVLAQEG